MFNQALTQAWIRLVWHTIVTWLCLFLHFRIALTALLKPALTSASLARAPSGQRPAVDRRR